MVLYTRNKRDASAVNVPVPRSMCDVGGSVGDSTSIIIV